LVRERKAKALKVKASKKTEKFIEELNKNLKFRHFRTRTKQSLGSVFLWEALASDKKLINEVWYCRSRYLEWLSWQTEAN